MSGGWRSVPFANVGNGSVESIEANAVILVHHVDDKQWPFATDMWQYVANGTILNDSVCNLIVHNYFFSDMFVIALLSLIVCKVTNFLDVIQLSELKYNK